MRELAPRPAFPDNSGMLDRLAIFGAKYLFLLILGTAGVWAMRQPMYVGIHHAIDVIGSMLIAVAVASFVRGASNVIETNRRAGRLEGE